MNENEEDYLKRPTPMVWLADTCRVSVSTMRKVMTSKPVTYGVACRVAKRLNMPMELIRMKPDLRGRFKRESPSQKKKPGTAGRKNG